MEKQKRGFGSPNFDKDKQREIARKGGLAAQKKGTAHRWTKAEARAAGIKARAKNELQH